MEVKGAGQDGGLDAIPMLSAQIKLPDVRKICGEVALQVKDFALVAALTASRGSGINSV